MSLGDQLETLINLSQDVHQARAILFDSGGDAQRWLSRAFFDPHMAGTEAPHMAAVAVGMLVINGDSEVRAALRDLPGLLDALGSLADPALDVPEQTRSIAADALITLGLSEEEFSGVLGNVEKQLICVALLNSPPPRNSPPLRGSPPHRSSPMRSNSPISASPSMHGRSPPSPDARSASPQHRLRCTADSLLPADSPRAASPKPPLPPRTATSPGRRLHQPKPEVRQQTLPEPASLQIPSWHPTAQHVEPNWTVPQPPMPLPPGVVAEAARRATDCLAACGIHHTAPRDPPAGVHVVVGPAGAMHTHAEHFERSRCAAVQQETAHCEMLSAQREMSPAMRVMQAQQQAMAHLQQEVARGAVEPTQYNQAMSLILSEQQVAAALDEASWLQSRGDAAMRELREQAVSSTLLVQDAAASQRDVAIQQQHDAVAATELLALERNAAIEQHLMAQAEFSKAAAVRTETIKHAAAAQHHAAMMHFEGGAAAMPFIAEDRDAAIIEQQVAVLDLQTAAATSALIAEERGAWMEQQHRALAHFESGMCANPMTPQGDHAIAQHHAAMMHMQSSAAMCAFEAREREAARATGVIRSESAATAPTANSSDAAPQPDAVLQYTQSSETSNHAHSVSSQAESIAAECEAALAELRNDQQPAPVTQFKAAAEANRALQALNSQREWHVTTAASGPSAALNMGLPHSAGTSASRLIAQREAALAELRSESRATTWWSDPPAAARGKPVPADADAEEAFWANAVQMRPGASSKADSKQEEFLVAGEQRDMLTALGQKLATRKPSCTTTELPPLLKDLKNHLPVAQRASNAQNQVLEAKHQWEADRRKQRERRRERELDRQQLQQQLRPQ